MRNVLAALAAALLALSLTACGNGGKVSDKQVRKALNHMMNSDSGTPRCSDVWQVGKTLDLRKYQGCKHGGTIEAVVTSGCYSKSSKYLGQVANYQDKFYVLQRGTNPKTGSGGKPGRITKTNPCS